MTNNKSIEIEIEGEFMIIDVEVETSDKTGEVKLVKWEFSKDVHPIMTALFNNCSPQYTLHLSKQIEEAVYQKL